MQRPRSASYLALLLGYTFGILLILCFVMQELSIQMKTMHELLLTLIAGQARQSEILTHQQQVSDYITSLHEFLGSDREMRKGYHKESRYHLYLVSQSFVS